MVEIKGKQFCENCFEESSTPFCTRCGYNPAVTANDPTMLQPGNVLLGKYIVGRIMGKGGFGVTYLAYDVSANRKVAIKEFFPYGVALRTTGTTTVSVASMDNAEAFKLGAEKFYNEAKLVSKFNGNPNIVGVYEFFYENDTVYFVMEYLKGCTLKEYIQKNGPLSAGQALFVTQNVANALMAAHSSNVLHRDISPDNIIICDNGDVKLIDFGAARQVVAEHSQSFSVILKPGFAPLEQYQKKGNQGPWTDIYSLGATAYYSLTEDIPEDPMSRLDDDEEYSSNKYKVNPELWNFISRATQLKIEDRYGDIFQLKKDLSTITIDPEPLVVPGDDSTQMPDFRTAMPFGMTQQAAPQTVSQPVGVGAPIQAAAPVGSPNAVYGQPVPPNVVPKKRPSKGKIAAVSAGAAAVVAAGIIIPIAVSKSNNNQENYPNYSYSTPANPGTSTPGAPAETKYSTKKVESANSHAKDMVASVNSWIADDVAAGGYEKTECELRICMNNGKATITDISGKNSWEGKKGISQRGAGETLQECFERDYPGKTFTARVFIDDSSYASYSWCVDDDAGFNGEAPSADDFKTGVYTWVSEDKEGMTRDGVIIGTSPRLAYSKSTTSKPSGSSTTSNGSSGNNEPTYVTNQSLGNGVMYTGGWKNGKPEGEGSKWNIDKTGNSGSIEKGTYSNGTLKSGSYLWVGSSNTYFFMSGECDASGALNDTSGEAYMEYCFAEGGDITYYLGSFSEGNRTDGQDWMMDYLGELTAEIGTFYYDSYGDKLSDGYHIEFDSKYNLVSCEKYTNGSKQNATSAEITKLKGVCTPEVIQLAISSHFGFTTEITDMANDIVKLGGPALQLP